MADSTQKMTDVLSFDQKTRSVMVQGNVQDNMKKKVAAVKEVVQNSSKNDIILVLEHFNQNVEQTIHAFVEGNHKAILEQWHSTSGTNKLSGRKKKRYKSGKNSPQVTAQNAVSGATLSTEVEHQVLEQRQNNTRRQRQSSQHSAADQLTSKEATDSVSDLNPAKDISQESIVCDPYQSKQPQVPNTTSEVSSAAVAAPSSSDHITSNRTMPSGGDKHRANSKRSSKSASKPADRPKELHLEASRERTVSESSTISASSKKPHGGLERCYKDLQRQLVSLQRHKLVIGEEMAKTQKELGKIFDELRDELNNREALLMYELNKEKNEAENWLNKRHKLALDLRHCLDKVPSMKEKDINNLRADIKHFVSERRKDDEIATTKRFTCDLEGFKSQIHSFGQVTQIKATYTTRQPDDMSLLTPQTATSKGTPTDVDKMDKSHVINSAEENQTNNKPESSLFVPVSGAKVISQSESLTRYEQLKPENQKPASAFPTRSSRGRDQRSRGQGSRGQQPRSQVQRGQGPRNQASRGQGFRGQAPRGQGQRGQQPRNQSTKDQTQEMNTQDHNVKNQQQKGETVMPNSEEQDVMKTSRGARHHEQLQEKRRSEERDKTRSDRQRQTDTEQKSARREGYNQKTTSPRKKNSKGQQQANNTADKGDVMRTDKQQEPNGKTSETADKVYKEKDDPTLHQMEAITLTSDVLSTAPMFLNKKQEPDNIAQSGVLDDNHQESNTEFPSSSQAPQESSIPVETHKPNLMSQRSVVVSVKEQAHDLRECNSHSDKNSATKQTMSDSGSFSKSSIDINANGLGIINGSLNGNVEQPSVKKATVSVEKLNEMSKATISVNGALPQRKGSSRRRDRGGNGEDHDKERSTNGVCDVSS